MNIHLNSRVIESTHRHVGKNSEVEFRKKELVRPFLVYHQNDEDDDSDDDDENTDNNSNSDADRLSNTW